MLYEVIPEELQRSEALKRRLVSDAAHELRTPLTNLVVGNSLLTGAGFPMCGEYDLKSYNFV